MSSAGKMDVVIGDYHIKRIKPDSQRQRPCCVSFVDDRFHIETEFVCKCKMEGKAKLSMKWTNKRVSERRGWRGTWTTEMGNLAMSLGSPAMRTMNICQ